MNKGRKPDLGNWKVKAVTGVIIGFSVLAIIGLLVTVIGVKTKKIIFMYNELSGKPNSSYGQFNHKGIYVTKDANGNLVISFNQPGSSNTDGNVSGVDETADDLDGDGLPDDIDPKPLTPNECTCSVKCTSSSHDDDCELCSVDYTKCKAGNKPIDFDGDIYNALLAAGFDETKAKAGAIIYSTIEPVYGHKAALALMACSFCEGTAGQFEGLKDYMTGKLGHSGLDKSYKGLYDMYHLSSKTSEQQYCLDTFIALGGKTISSAQQAKDWQKACDILKSYCGYSGGQGIGFIQFSGGRRTPRLQAYSTATDFSDSGRWSSEMQACLSEIAGNSGYKSAFEQSYSNSQTAVDTIFKTYISGGSSRGIDKRRAMMTQICSAIPFEG